MKMVFKEIQILLSKIKFFYLILIFSPFFFIIFYLLYAFFKLNKIYTETKAKVLKNLAIDPQGEKKLRFLEERKNYYVFVLVLIFITFVIMYYLEIKSLIKLYLHF